MSYGVKVSDRGFDVTSDDKNQAVNTKYNSPKVDVKADPPHFDVFKHVINSSLAADTYLLKTVKHSYGYIPMVLAHCVHPESANYAKTAGILPFPVVAAGIVLYEWKAVAFADRVEFRLLVNTGDTSGEEVTIRYYIFAEAGA